MKHYQYVAEAVYCITRFLFMKFALIMLVSKFLIFSDDNSVINLTTEDQ